MSEILLSRLENEKTIGAEYYSPVFISLFRKLVFNGFQIKNLFDCCSLITDGDHGSADYVGSDETIFVLSEAVKDGWIDINACRYISDRYAETLDRSKLKKNDVLVTKTGIYFGKSAVVTEEFVGANTIAHVGLLRPKKEINPYYLSTFLNCHYGYSQLRRRGIKSTRPEVKLIELKDIKICILNADFQTKIENVISLSKKCLFFSNLKYLSAERLLLEQINFISCFSKFNNISIKFFQTSFVKTGRLDAEYYQPKYEDLIEHILKSPHKKLCDLAKTRKSIEPGSNAYSDSPEGLPFLRVADYDKFGVNTPQKRLSSEFIAENVEKINALKPKKQTILFAKDGSIGQAYCLDKDANFITSGAILHLSIKDKEKILPDYLTLVLNSPLVQMQAERDVGGSVILHWRTCEIEQVLIPIIEIEKQKQIATLIQQSFALKAQSQRLLDVAKRAVEMAIEQDEQTALDFLEKETRELNQLIAS